MEPLVRGWWPRRPRRMTRDKDPQNLISSRVALDQMTDAAVRSSFLDLTLDPSDTVWWFCFFFSSLSSCPHLQPHFVTAANISLPHLTGGFMRSSSVSATLVALMHQGNSSLAFCAPPALSPCILYSLSKCYNYRVYATTRYCLLSVSLSLSTRRIVE